MRTRIIFIISTLILVLILFFSGCTNDLSNFNNSNSQSGHSKMTKLYTKTLPTITYTNKKVNTFNINSQSANVIIVVSKINKITIQREILSRAGVKGFSYIKNINAKILNKNLTLSNTMENINNNGLVSIKYTISLPKTILLNNIQVVQGEININGNFVCKTIEDSQGSIIINIGPINNQLIILNSQGSIAINAGAINKPIIIKN